MRPWARQLLFSVNSFSAAMLALYIAFSIGLPRPYWAMATTYIVSQPLSGALRSKGTYRLIGTLIGGAAAVALVPPLANAPPLLSLALALWVGGCLYVSLLDRTPRSYVFILAGYTAAIIGFPIAPAPQGVFDTAVARMEEIGLGVVCATVVHTLVAPRGVGPVLVQRINGWLADAQGWMLDVLAGQSDPDKAKARQRLAADATEIRILSTHLPFDTTAFRETTQVVRALQDRMTLLLPLIAAVGDRLEVLRAEGPPPAPVQAALQRMAAWIGDTEAPRADGEVIHRDLARLEPRFGAAAGWREAVLDNLLDRLRLSIDAVQDVRDLRTSLRSGARRLPANLAEVDRARRGTPLHRDRYLAFLSGFAAFAAVLACCVVWIGFGWNEGSVAAMTAAVFCSFFATQDDPAPAIASFTWYTVFSLPVVALYQFAILPAIDGFPMLCLALAPPMLAVGYFIADPRFTSRAMPVALGISNGLALAETFSADFAGFVNGNIAQIVGLVAAFLITRLFRSVGAEWSARRILRAGWRELARLAAASGPADRTGFTIAMLDRAGLLAPRVALSPTPGGGRSAAALGEIRVGLNLDGLQRARRELTTAEEAEGRQAIRRVLDGVAAYYRGLITGHARAEPTLTPAPCEPSPALLGELDAALAATLPSAARPEVREGVRALIGLRRSLFPAAPGFDAPPEAAA